MTELYFKGKEFVHNHHLTVPHRPLVPHPEKGIGAPRLDGNLIVQGDNLHALKALLPHYAGKVDLVYIDPPYNTGSDDFAYNDRVNSPMIKEWLNANPVGLDDSLRHDKWCAMMWPRLQMIKELLADEGAVFISINSIEYAHLRLMCDAIFSELNYIGEFIWKSRQNKDNRNDNGLSNDHEFILVYGAGLDGEVRSVTDYANSDDDVRGPWVSANMVGLASRAARPNLHYDLINNETGINYGCPRRGWRFELATMEQLKAEKRVLWPEKKTGRPRRKAFLSELPGRTNATSVFPLPIFTRTGTSLLSKIMGEAEFAFPKPYELVLHFIGLFERKDLLVLDSFAGSGTTAHAVIEANNRDGGNRRAILVEMEEYADRVTAERVRRIINGYTFKGKQTTELLREKLNWTKLQMANRLTDKVQKIELLHGKKYDRITKQVKDGELIVIGEKQVAERIEGLGGEFTYCTLGEPIDLNRILTGEALPTFADLGTVLFNTATSQTIDLGQMDEATGYLGTAAGAKLWLIYRSDIDWLKTPQAALTLDFARTITEADKGARHVVFAPANHTSPKLLQHHKLTNVEFAPLPYALYRLERT